jgi:CMP-N,N'-diacetyllegionaminic acid synthase
MKVLLIGYGSIGKRHHKVLGEIYDNIDIHLVSQHAKLKTTVFKNLSDVEDFSTYLYFIIASETHLHLDQLIYINSRVQNKTILIEKPIFNKKPNNITLQNQIFVGYNLRFDPILERVKRILSNEKAIYFNSFVGQYLPTWHLEGNYRNTYSAQSTKGGGVTLDLSHEIDYVKWILGDFKNVKGACLKVSDLEIDTDDLCQIIGTSQAGSAFQISMDYISKIPIRQCIIHTNSATIQADLINRRLTVTTIDKTTEEVFKWQENDSTYHRMHQAILSSKKHNACQFKEAITTIELCLKLKSNSKESI